MLVSLILSPAALAQHAQAPPPLIANISLDRAQAFVNEQVLIVVELKARDDTFGLTGQPPIVSSGKLISLRKTDSVERINQTSYQTTTRTYAFFPSEEGRLVLPSFRFQALLPVVQEGDDAGQNPRVMAETGSIDLLVSKPPNATASWLPAVDLSISQAWLADRIAGQHPAAIAPLQLRSRPALRQYAEPVTWLVDTDDQGLNGELMQTISYIATSDGQTQIPGIVVDWWDINQKQWRKSELPAQTVQIGELDGFSLNTRSWRIDIVRAIGIAALFIAVVYSIRKLRHRFDRPNKRKAWRRIQQKQNPLLNQVIVSVDASLYGCQRTNLNWTEIKTKLDAVRKQGDQAAIQKPALENLY